MERTAMTERIMAVLQLFLTVNRVVDQVHKFCSLTHVFEGVLACDCIETDLVEKEKSGVFAVLNL